MRRIQFTQLISLCANYARRELNTGSRMGSDEKDA
jgi:hypothetical protein